MHDGKFSGEYNLEALKAAIAAAALSVGSAALFAVSVQVEQPDPLPGGSA